MLKHSNEMDYRQTSCYLKITAGKSLQIHTPYQCLKIPHPHLKMLNVKRFDISAI